MYGEGLRENEVESPVTFSESTRCESMGALGEDWGGKEVTYEGR